MKSQVFALAGVAGAMFVAGSAPAAYTGLVVESYIGAGWEMAGYDATALDTYRVYATFDDALGVITAVGDSSGLFELTSRDGSFFNASSPTAGDFPNNPALWPLPGFEDGQWDTFVTIGSDGEPVPVTAGAPGFTTQAAGLTGDTFLNNSGWFVSGFPPQGDATDGRVLVAQLTVAEGIGVDGRNWRVSGLTESGNSNSSFDILSDFSAPTIPAPGAVALLGLAGLVSRRRRRG